MIIEAIALTSLLGLQDGSTVYTDLKNCQVVEEGEEYTSYKCAGAGGYSLGKLQHDGHELLSLVAPDGKEHDLMFRALADDAVSSTLGAKAEWRLAKKGGKDEPFALIVRWNVVLASGKKISMLTVSKIARDQVCLVAKVGPTKTQNQDARDYADRALEAKCLF
jgi:hypothetical protein